MKSLRDVQRTCEICPEVTSTLCSTDVPRKSVQPIILESNSLALNHSIKFITITFLTLFRMGFFGAVTDVGGPPSLKSATHIIQ